MISTPPRDAICAGLCASLLLGLAATACTTGGSTDGPAATVPAQGAVGLGTASDIAAADAWARAATAGTNSAAYMRLTNAAAEDDTLTAVDADVTSMASIHETVVEDGMARMAELEMGLDVPAGGEVELAPGGWHVMLMDLTRDLVPGETITLTLHFARAGEISAPAQVRSPADEP